MDRRQRCSVVDPVLVARHVRATYKADLGELRAFLPGRVPLDELPSAFEPYLSACAQLPLRYPADSGGVRRSLEAEFPRDDPAARNAIPELGEAERDRLMTALAVLGHTYRWDCVPPAPARFEERQIALHRGSPGRGRRWPGAAGSPVSGRRGASTCATGG